LVGGWQYMQITRRNWSTIVVVFALFLSLLTSPVKAESDTTLFTDVPSNKSYASAVYQLAKRNLISGYKDGTFKPDAAITRGQAASIIAKLLKLDTKNIKKDPGFTDVSSQHSNFGAIAAVAEKGIFSGYADGRFGPNDKITRAQMASILIKAFDFHYYSYSYLESPFKDIEKLASHQDSVYTLYRLRVTSGTSPTTYSPNHPISRAQAAVLITKTEKVRSATITLKASDYGWFLFRGYDDYHKRYLAPEQNEPEIIQVIPNKKTAKVLQIVPMKIGKQKFSINGQKENTGIENVESKKYYVHVSNANGQLKMNFEETTDVFSSNARLTVTKEPVKKVSLAKMDGSKVDDSIEFQNCHQYVSINVICFPVSEEGEYIATVEYENGKRVRYGVESILIPSDFYYRTYSIEEKPSVTIDLSNDKGDFSVYKVQDPTKIVKVIRKENSDIFHIQGLSEGNTYIDFPKSDRKKEGTLGLNVTVQKIGSIIRVDVSRYDYYDQFM
jgi:hypothetical protein